MGMSMPMGGNGMPPWPSMQPFTPQQPATRTTSGSSQEGPQSGSQGQIMPPGNMTQVPPIFGFPSGMGFGEGEGLSPRLQGGGLQLQGKLSADVRMTAGGRPRCAMKRTRDPHPAQERLKRRRRTGARSVHTSPAAAQGVPERPRTSTRTKWRRTLPRTAPAGLGARVSGGRPHG